MGAKPGSTNGGGGGRPKGRLNKATEERLFLQAREKHEAQAKGRKLAKEVLDDFMHLTGNMALTYRPALPTEQPNPNADEAKFWKCVEMARDFATALAKYQSPTFKAIATYSAPDVVAPEAIDLKANPNVVPITQDAESAIRTYKRLIAVVR